mmetsp:Transcript_11031/g.26159  ORF Transcript_11031/g.26159 Transcript_11031/m.26159 type:complete len:355 (-) Transcript_11031:206-1270(-)
MAEVSLTLQTRLFSASSHPCDATEVLPAELWRHIFSHLPQTKSGAVLRRVRLVCKCFAIEAAKEVKNLQFSERLSESAQGWKSTFARFSSVESFACRRCLFSELLRALPVLSNLKALKLGGICCVKGTTEVTDKHFKLLEQLTGLQTLSLKSCRWVTDEAVSSLQSLTGLTDLSLQNCTSLTSRAFSFLQPLTGIVSLEVTGLAAVGDEALLCVASFSSLQNLNLWTCRSTGFTDRGLAYIGALTELQTLDLSGSRGFTNLGLVALRPLTNLRELNIGPCSSITDAGLAPLRSLVNLKSLTLSAPSVSNAGLRDLQPLKRLTYLNFNGCGHHPDEAMYGTSWRHDILPLLAETV